MKTFFISDLHFSHTNIIFYESRPFESTEDMNKQLIANWNKKVTNKDRVFILGDFSFDKNMNKTDEFFKSLNGQKFLIRGNHDTKHSISEWLKNASQMKEYQMIKLDNNYIVMSHYPFTVWEKSHNGSISLYGHVHSKILFTPVKNQYNVSCEVLDYEPCTLEEIIEKNKKWLNKK